MTKIIHYCWFGNNPIPKKLQQCMDSWRLVMPDYEIRRWDETVFDVNSVQWTKEAYNKGKYAFVSDYVRLVALYEYGGIYLDTDVKLLKDLEPLYRKYPNFMGFENGKVLTSAVMCVEAKHPIVKDFLDYYTNKSFSSTIVEENEANVLMMTKALERYGLRVDNSEQDVDVLPSSIHIFPRTYFCPLDFYHNKDFSSNTYAVHYFDASWLDCDTKTRIEKERTFMYKVKSTILQILSDIKHSISR